MAKKKKITTVKDKFSQKQISIHSLIEEIKEDVPQKASRAVLAKKRADLKQLIKTRIKPSKDKLRYLNKKYNQEKNPFEKLKVAYEIESVEKKLKSLNLDSSKNYINKLAGKDFYYNVDTGFKVHRIYRSEIDKMKDNSKFLELMKGDVESSIKDLEFKIKHNIETKYNKETKMKVLKGNLMDIINKNIKIDKIRDMDMDSLDKKTKRSVNLMSNTEIEKSVKQGEYPIEVIFSNDYIGLL